MSLSDWGLFCLDKNCLIALIRDALMWLEVRGFGFWMFSMISRRPSLKASSKWLQCLLKPKPLQEHVFLVILYSLPLSDKMIKPSWTIL